MVTRMCSAFTKIQKRGGLTFSVLHLNESSIEFTDSRQHILIIVPLKDALN